MSGCLLVSRGYPINGGREEEWFDIVSVAMLFRVGRPSKNKLYLVPSICKTGVVKSSTHKDRTRIPPGCYSSLLIGKLANKGR